MDNPQFLSPMGTFIKKPAHRDWNSASMLTRIMDVAYGVGLFILNQYSKLPPFKPGDKRSGSIMTGHGTIGKGKICDS
jgi:hypothetical protein